MIISSWWVCSNHIRRLSVSGVQDRERSFSMPIISTRSCAKQGEQKTFGGFCMEWWIWVAIGVAIIALAIDFAIIGGMDPRKWKGGKQ